jgi:glycosyltransferase involved in cell wall biosynthesis
LNKIAFSICIPNYNYEKYLGETIQSVLDQTCPDFEIVVVDNASNDRSVEVVRSFPDPRIRLYVNPCNVGFGPNLDRAASRASNPYILVLSSDDLMRPDALREYAEVLQTLGEEAEDVLLVSAIDIVDGQGTKTGYRDRRSYYEIAPDPVLTGRFNCPEIEAFQGLQVFKATYPHMSVPGHFCTTLFSKTLYEKVGGYSSINPIGPDAHLDYKILLTGAPVIFINHPLFAYRVHTSNQLSSSRKNKTLKVPINVYLFSVDYSDNDLARAGVDRSEIVSFLVDGTCLKGGLEELRYGSWLQAFRYLMFALAAAPGTTLKNPISYGLALLLLTGPFAPAIARTLYRFHKNMDQ